MKTFTPPPPSNFGSNEGPQVLTSLSKGKRPLKWNSLNAILTFTSFFWLSFFVFSLLGCQRSIDDVTQVNQKSYPTVDLNDPNFSWFTLDQKLFDAERITFVRNEESLTVDTKLFKNDNGELIVFEAARDIEGFVSSGNRSCTETTCCIADCYNSDCSSIVGTADLLMHIGNYGTYVTPCEGGDLNGDGYVGNSDSLIFFAYYGTECSEDCEC